jgi:hypothetical protein
MRKLKIAAITAGLAVIAAGGVLGLTYQHSASSASSASLPPGPANKIDTASEEVPVALSVPAGQKAVASMQVERGVQVYTCTNKSWTLLEPDAVLRSGSTLVLHTKGPQWISPEDGSAVVGAAVSTVSRPGAIPELLLKSTANRGTGLFGSVDFIQRLNTKGGVAPAGSCAVGAQTAVPYSADYRFYAPDATHQ